MMQLGVLLFALLIAGAVGQNISMSVLQNLAVFSNAKSCADTETYFYKICSSTSMSEMCWSGTSVLRVPCSDPNPYCMGGDCYSGEAIFSKCPNPNGFYPGPSGCRDYYICHNGQPNLVKCKEMSMYDPVSKTCVGETILKSCYAFNCADKDETYVPYTGDARIHTRCVKGAPVELYECSGENEVMVVSAQKCLTTCNVPGNIEDPDNCRGYIECSHDDEQNYWYNPRTCPSDMHFDTYTMLCAPGHRCPQEIPMVNH